MFNLFFQPILKAGDEVNEPSEREQLRTVLKRMGELRCMHEVRARGSRSFSPESQVCLSVVLSHPSSSSLAEFLLCHLMASDGTYIFRSLVVIDSSLFFLFTSIFSLIPLA